MDVLTIAALIVLALTNVSFAALAHREHVRAESAQRELTRLVAQSRPRPPHQDNAAGYDTGLVEL